MEVDEGASADANMASQASHMDAQFEEHKGETNVSKLAASARLVIRASLRCRN